MDKATIEKIEAVEYDDSEEPTFDSNHEPTIDWWDEEWQKSYDELSNFYLNDEVYNG